MSKTKLFNLLALGAMGLITGYAVNTVKVYERNAENDQERYFRLLDKFNESQSELEDVRGDMLEYMAECDKLKKQVDMLNYALDTERRLKLKEV